MGVVISEEVYRVSVQNVQRAAGPACKLDAYSSDNVTIREQNTSGAAGKIKSAESDLRCLSVFKQ